LALSDFDRIDAVEISRDVLEAAPLFQADNYRVFDKPNVQFIIDDGRNFLLTTENTYDVITFEPMPLAVAGVSTFYTREYYELCRARLAPGGLVSQWIPLHSLNLDVVRSLVRTFRSVFPECCVWFVNSDLFVVGSNQPLRVDYARVRQRLAAEQLSNALHAVGLDDPAELLSCYFMGKEALATFAGPGEVMTDDRPWAEFIAPKLIYEQTVEKSLAGLRPLYSPSLDILDTDGLPASEAATVRATLDRRRQARMHDLEGIQSFYGGMIGGDQEQYFLAALATDPDDVTAQSYLGDMATQRVHLFIRWKEFDQAETYLAKILAAMPDAPNLLALRDELVNAKAEPLKAPPRR
jgi:hypothetical protein